MLWDTIVKSAQANKARIAVGVGEQYMDKTIQGAEQAAEKGYASVILVGPKRMDTILPTVVSENPEAELIKLARDGKVDGVVRGSLGANTTLKCLKEIMGIKRVLRVSLLKTPSGRFFFFAPVGVDEGWTVEDKVELGELGAGLMRRFGVEPNIGVLSGGRLGDRGRSERVDRTLDDAEAVARILTEKGIKAKHAEILIEDAVNEYNYIIAPDGISGNLIFRALCLVGGGEGYGAPLVGADIVYVDTSRAGTGYENAICLASALVLH
ncbi:phosphotransacetylase [Methanocella sp. CWC-04]|uniref:Phosphotransacetylase n=1 Tax=Methanooceanicella nereidis TaxID=2052831 RepID=A0AAP2W628_9EURY|nr:methanogenesis marker protein Mmp4/MtxX [Methanocella sp. CWC-04]MCD1296250.1 phosphotransacetylase [Methanocella sp. CWC-04]